MGLSVGDYILYTLYFADDQLVIAEDKEDLEYMVRKLNEAYSAAGLTININKSEYLQVENDAVSDLELEGQTIRCVAKRKYLRGTLKSKGTSTDEIDHRIDMGRKVIGALNSMWWGKHIHKNTKKRLYSSLVSSVTLLLLTLGTAIGDNDLDC